MEKSTPLEVRSRRNLPIRQRRIGLLTGSNFFAAALLGLMFVLMFFSAWNDSATMDELAHIPAGYSYLTKQDYRLNPEHPPLIKDLAALPLLFLNLNFPTDKPAWTKDINGQWTMGSIFLYESGNDADKILRFSRFPIMLLAIFFGWILFRWARGLYGNRVALLTLFFYSFSPTFIAHSRYVTTDLAAAFGFFIGIVYFVKFLEWQNKKWILAAGAVLGIALLLKFSLFLLLPLYVIFGFLWVFLNHYEETKKLEFKKRFFHLIKEWLKIAGKIFLIFLIAGAVVWLVYEYHVWNYPIEKQKADAEFTLTSFGFRPLANLVIFMSDKLFLRPFSQYLLGLLMVVQRSSGGNTAYFWGEVSATGWKLYFPIAYLLKEHLAFHLLALLAGLAAIITIVRSKQKNFQNFLEWLKDNFALTAGIIFIAVYWIQSILSPLNIGVRHILPTLPFIYILVSRQLIRRLFSFEVSEEPKNIWEVLKIIYRHYVRNVPKYLILFAAILWIFSATVFSFPYYLSYYNELAGGTKNGYKYIVDSNYDWGHDLKRLKFFVEKNEIPKIYLDYFGGGSPGYYFGEKFVPWNSAKGAPPPNSWFAVSATFLQGARAKPVKGFIVNSEDSYFWLKERTPVNRAGASIFIYKF